MSLRGKYSCAQIHLLPRMLNAQCPPFSLPPRSRPCRFQLQLWPWIPQGTLERVASDSRVELARWREKRAQVPSCQQKAPINGGWHMQPLPLIRRLDLTSLLFLCLLSLNFWPCLCPCIGTSGCTQPCLLSRDSAAQWLTGKRLPAMRQKMGHPPLSGIR